MDHVKDGLGSVLEDVLESRITLVWQEELQITFHIFNCKIVHKYKWHFNSINIKSLLNTIEISLGLNGSGKYS